ncbi:AbrB/MazE/SpoVT family DNA-binding domain-containing protein [Sulfurospirillum sp. T05]|uniref:AbrB/MazE/SpoVT family DNA-binding domain-containing protein n=1 Tax=Sulfurospirillum tamanense TaxID=2813362 RepID=A0ABS2WPS5_9BACT|nr:AbrB/MazE/SpoVT family DNA-binding domain-containing protein [Sulfurospirillum tamanensis]MBN2963572.1 AbrB/MazE/SpoVT family DNA-binding domain-containing protein [Sulfurospirillum tamanensis]
MIATISSWGNSQGLRLPKGVIKELHLSVGDKINIVVENEKIVLEPLKASRQKYDIKTLVSKLPKNHQAHEEFNNKSGQEEW